MLTIILFVYNFIFQRAINVNKLETYSRFVTYYFLWFSHVANSIIRYYESPYDAETETLLSLQLNKS